MHPLWETWADLVHPDAQKILENLEDNREWFASQLPPDSPSSSNKQTANEQSMDEEEEDEAQDEEQEHDDEENDSEKGDHLNQIQKGRDGNVDEDDEEDDEKTLAEPLSTQLAQQNMSQMANSEADHLD